MSLGKVIVDPSDEHPKVPTTNNQAERSLRPVVIRRGVIQDTRSAKGLENHGVVRSLFETAKRQCNKAHRFLRDLFTKNTAGAQAALYRNPPRKKSASPKDTPPDKPP